MYILRPKLRISRFFDPFLPFFFAKGGPFISKTPHTCFCDNIRLHGGWHTPCGLPRTLFAASMPFCWAMKSLIETEKRQKTIFTTIEEPLKAQTKHFFRKCPFTEPLKTSSPFKSYNL
jgi:hypothetical protein